MSRSSRMERPTVLVAQSLRGEHLPLLISLSSRPARLLVVSADFDHYRNCCRRSAKSATSRSRCRVLLMKPCGCFRKLATSNTDSISQESTSVPLQSLSLVVSMLSGDRIARVAGFGTNNKIPMGFYLQSHALEIFCEDFCNLKKWATLKLRIS
jgi:hypothetical protein